MNVFAKFDEIPSTILQDIKETKRYRHTDGRTDVKTVYPPTNTVCGGINIIALVPLKAVKAYKRECAIQHNF